MPIFEFRCSECSTRFADLVGMTGDSEQPKCPKCGTSAVTKLVSRVGRYRTEDQRIEQLSDRLDRIGDPDSTTEAREIAKEMGRAMDDDMSDEMEQMFEADVDDLGENS